jgi:ketosteroid isomerase-like protein
MIRAASYQLDGAVRLDQSSAWWENRNIALLREAVPMMKFASDEAAAAAKGPVAAEALAARQELDAAFAAQDVDAVSALCAKDLVVNTPANRVARLAQVLGFFKAGRMNYESADETIEAVDVREDCVVIMGEEVVKPRGRAANAGKIVRRRFTDVWRKESGGRWRLTIRQATIASVE